MRRTVLQTARLTTSALSHIGRRGRIRTLVDDFGDHSPRPLNNSPVLAERSGLEPHTFQYQPISSRSQYLTGLRSVWLPRLVSNQRIRESKSRALPLGYGAMYTYVLARICTLHKRSVICDSTDLTPMRSSLVLPMCLPIPPQHNYLSMRRISIGSLSPCGDPIVALPGEF